MILYSKEVYGIIHKQFQKFYSLKYFVKTYCDEFYDYTVIIVKFITIRQKLYNLSIHESVLSLQNLICLQNQLPKTRTLIFIVSSFCSNVNIFNKEYILLLQVNNNQFNIIITYYLLVTYY